MIAGREAVRMGIMRATIHLVSARDCMRLYPLMWPVLERGFRGSPFSKHIAGVDLDDLLATGRELLAAQPRTRAELSPLLAERWPGTDPASLAYAVTFLTPLVQVPPRGLWRQSAQPRLTTAQAWLGRELEEHPSLADAILRYLAAFGPATVKDIQAWCGLTRLAAVVDEIGDHLRVFADEHGNRASRRPRRPAARSHDPRAAAVPPALRQRDPLACRPQPDHRARAPRHRLQRQADADLPRRRLRRGDLAHRRLDDPSPAIRAAGRRRSLRADRRGAATARISPSRSCARERSDRRAFPPAALLNGGNAASAANAR